VKTVSRARKVFDWVLGLTLLVLGIAGLFLPVLQGVLLILAGLGVLSSHSRLARKAREALTSRLRRVKDNLMKRN
jgi:uncharacterized protein YqgC (DUF456 family)